ncbi:MBL fold metallo-hydrolase [Sphingosinicellaceae bacterium]|nr:MBL fold metallo-hydrolase [Sphingosinicellaceae bacterium]
MNNQSSPACRSKYAVVHRHLTNLLLAAFTLAALPATARPIEHFTLPDWSTTEVADRDLGGGVHMMESYGGNNGVVVGEDGVLLVDAEWPQLNAKLRARIAALSPLPVRYLVDTHWHWDHVGGNGLWARTGAVILSSPQTRRHIVEAQRASTAPAGQPYARDTRAVPVITVGNGDQLHVGGQTIEIIKVPPAHTDGDLAIRYVEANVIQTGDTFFHGFYPDIDIDHGGTIDGMIAWYDTLYAMCDARTKIIPGHGSVATRDDVKTYQAMLKTVRSRVAAAIAKGLTEEQLIAAHPLDDLDVAWGGNLMKQPYLLAIVYEDLKRPRAR